MRINIEIIGTAPMLMNRFAEDEEAGPPVPKGTRREQAAQTAYLDAKGKVCFPLRNVLSALTNAGKFHKVGKMKVTTPKSSLVPAAICLVGADDLPLMDPVSNQQLDTFEVDSRRVVNHATGSALMRHRARINSWCLRFALDVDPDVLPLDLVRKLVVDAGKKIGLGDFRPDRRGPFGKFEITNWEEVAPEKKSRSRKVG